MKISSLIGKQLLSPTGETLGYVVNALLTRDMKKLACLVCADGEEEEFYLPARAVTGYGDVLIVTAARLDRPAGEAPPVMKPVYLSTGEAAGRTTDFAFGEEEPALLVGEKRYPLASVVLGENAIVYPSPNKRPARRKQPEKQGKAPALPAAPEPVNAAINRVNLIGRRVKKSVYDGEGKPIALAGEYVTPAVLSAARRQNRLLQLTVNTLTNLF